MRRFYSRLSSIEEKKNQRRAFIYIVLTLISLLVLIFFGLPSMAKMAAFLSDLRKSTVPVEKKDITPPAPPKFDNLPDATNKKTFALQGSAEEGASVKIFINDKEETVISDKEGRFNLSLNLSEGENKISALAKDVNGNESQKSDEVVIVFDNTAPSLEISAPENNKQFFGSKQRQIIIDGETEEGASVTINERFVSVEEDGSFAFTTTLTDGENAFNIKAQDKAGNTTESSLTLKFSP